MSRSNPVRHTLVFKRLEMERLVEEVGWEGADNELLNIRRSFGSFQCSGGELKVLSMSGQHKNRAAEAREKCVCLLVEDLAEGRESFILRGSARFAGCPPAVFVP